MTMESLKNAIGVIAEKLDENKEYLIQLDQQNGDGDLGISMSSGIHAVQDYLASNGETDLGKTLNRCGDFFNEAAPSSLGTIIAFFFKGMAKSLKGKENCSVLELAESMQAGLDNVIQKAKSKPGEKTILDSLTPGVAALREYAGEPDAFTRAARAAREGSEKTRRMKAVWGRAAYYGENSVGILDGGSVVGALVFEALDEMKRNEEEE